MVSNLRCSNSSFPYQQTTIIPVSFADAGINTKLAEDLLSLIFTNRTFSHPPYSNIILGSHENAIQSINTFPPCGIKWVLCLMISRVLSITACSMLDSASA